MIDTQVCILILLFHWRASSEIKIQGRATCQIDIQVFILILLFHWPAISMMDA